jgi:predicted SnoaL-like aldol condensation-catalyzing enzyme
MRFLTSFIVTLLVSTSALALDMNIARQSLDAARPKPPRVCNPNTKGNDLGQKQYEALADYANLFVFKQDVQTSFDRYVPGFVSGLIYQRGTRALTNQPPSEYKQHNPFGEQGREFAIEFLKNGFAGGIKTSHLTIFSGQGYGIMHYKAQFLSDNVTMAVVDYFKFKGTCIVEHWDVLQEITGTEPNPIAFF